LNKKQNSHIVGKEKKIKRNFFFSGGLNKRFIHTVLKANYLNWEILIVILYLQP
jgi:hypothetical protein